MAGLLWVEGSHLGTCQLDALEHSVVDMLWLEHEEELVGQKLHGGGKVSLYSCGGTPCTGGLCSRVIAEIVQTLCLEYFNHCMCFLSFPLCVILEGLMWGLEEY